MTCQLSQLSRTCSTQKKFTCLIKINNLEAYVLCQRRGALAGRVKTLQVKELLQVVGLTKNSYSIAKLTHCLTNTTTN